MLIDDELLSYLLDGNDFCFCRACWSRRGIMGEMTSFHGLVLYSFFCCSSISACLGWMDGRTVFGLIHVLDAIKMEWDVMDRLG